MIKKTILLTIILVLTTVSTFAQQVEVLSLGTFHFAFYNADVIKTAKKDQIDVLDAKYQREIEEIVSKLSKFKPTHIAVEVDPEKQSHIDSLYQKFLNGDYQLGRNETEQLGFRMAKQFGHQKLFCVNAWGKHSEEVLRVLDGTDSIANLKFMDYFYNNPDTSIFYNRESVFKTHGILEELRQSNSEGDLKKDLGNYLISIFKYESEDNEYFGVDFTTSWWFNRNLRIFRNIQKIDTKPGDRIVVIFGSGHANILNPLFDVSPEYKLVNTNEYLK